LPTKEELLEAKNKVVEDVIQPNLDILFCGINPGLFTAYTGFHFARPGNRFWKALYLSGLTPAVFKPSEQEKLLELGMGITNVVSRASATAAEISRQEYIEGGEKLRQKLLIFKPNILAILG